MLRHLTQEAFGRHGPVRPLCARAALAILST